MDGNSDFTLNDLLLIFIAAIISASTIGFRMWLNRFAKDAEEDREEAREERKENRDVHEKMWEAIGNNRSEAEAAKGLARTANEKIIDHANNHPAHRSR